MDVILQGSRRRATLLGGGFRNMFVSASSGERTYTAAKAAGVDFTRDRRSMPYDTLAIMAMVEPYQRRTTADGIFSGTAAELRDLESRLYLATKANEAYEAEVRDYYGTRVSRTSGGKRARLRDERAMLVNESANARKVAAAAIMDLRAMKIAEVASNMPTDPDSIVMVRNPDSGRIEYSVVQAAPGTTAALRESKSSGKIPGSLFLIPVGIAAAYLLAKG